MKTQKFWIFLICIGISHLLYAQEAAHPLILNAGISRTLVWDNYGFYGGVDRGIQAMGKLFLGVQISYYFAQDPFKNGFSNGDLGVIGRSHEFNIWLRAQYAFNINKSGSVQFLPGVFAGYSAYHTKGGIQNSELGIRRNYKNKYGFLNRGFSLAANWQMNRRLVLDSSVQISLKELTDFDQVGMSSVSDPESRIYGSLGLKYHLLR